MWEQLKKEYADDDEILYHIDCIIILLNRRKECEIDEQKRQKAIEKIYNKYDRYFKRRKL